MRQNCWWCQPRSPQIFAGVEQLRILSKKTASSNGIKSVNAMKNKLLLISFAALAIASCSKNELVPSSQTRLDAILAGDPVEETKTAIGEKTEQGYPVVWTVGDCISVNGCPSQELAEGDIDGKKASFTIEGVITSPYKAVYPLSAAEWNGEDCTVKLPATQNYVAGSFDPAASVMLSSGKSLTFQNVLAYLKLTVNRGETDAAISEVKVAGNNGEALSGSFAAVFGDICTIASEGNGEAVTLDCGAEGVALGTPLIIALPAKAYAGGLNITVTTLDGKVQKVTSSKEFNACAGKIYTTSFTFSETPVQEPEIATEADLIAFLNAADGGVKCTNTTAAVAKENAEFGDYSQWVASDGKVHITADITLTQTVDWSATESARSCTVSNFDGIIDGGGHTITFEGAVKTPMFINLYGIISDLKFAGNMTVTHSPYLGAPFVCVVQEGGIIDNCVNKMNVNYSTSDKAEWENLYIAGIAVRSYGKIQNCVNEGTIEAAGRIGTTAFVGGICAVVYEKAAVASCINRGNIVTTIKKTSDGTTDLARAGGVASWVYGKLEDCTNEADIVFTGKLGFGGVAFYNQGGNFSGCRNTGALSVDTDLSRLGGIVYINNGGTLTSCANSGTLTCPNSKCEIGGIAVCSKGEGATIDNCENNGVIKVTGSGTRAGGICFNMNAGVVQNCKNTANIIFETVPSSAGEVQFIGGIVGITSETDLTLTSIVNIFSTGSYVIPTSTYSKNTLSSKLLISGCTNTGILKMTVTPESSAAFVRNVAIGGILGWNWAVATADNYVEILNCTNGAASAGTDESYYYVQYVQEKNNPTYLSPALGGILGQSAPYNSSSSGWSIAPFTKGFAKDSAREGMKIVIDGCKSYGVVANTASYSSTPTSPTTRSIRGTGGIAGLIYGGSEEALAAKIRNCTVNTYVLVGLTTASDKQSVENCAGGIAGAAAWCDVDNCTVNSPVSGSGVGSNECYAMAAGGVFGSVTERYSVTNCNLNMSMGFKCTKTAYWGLVSGGSNYATRTQGYVSIKGSVISGNKFNPGPVTIKGVVQEITSANFTDYLISSADKTDNETNGWLTMSNNTWTGK